MSTPHLVPRDEIPNIHRPFSMDVAGRAAKAARIFDVLAILVLIGGGITALLGLIVMVQSNYRLGLLVLGCAVVWTALTWASITLATVVCGYIAQKVGA